MDTFSQFYGAGLHSEDFELPSENAGRKLVAFVLREFFEGLVSLRTQDLIANLLDLNAIEQFIGKRERCDVGAILKQSLERQQSAAARRQIVFLSGISGGLWAQAEPAVLRRVFDKVISNAVKYSPPNSTIQVHALPENGNIIVNVRDQGVGINEEGPAKTFPEICATGGLSGGRAMLGGSPAGHCQEIG